MQPEYLHHAGEASRLDHTKQDIRFGRFIEFTEVMVAMSAVALIAVAFALFIFL